MNCMLRTVCRLQSPLSTLIPLSHANAYRPCYTTPCGSHIQHSTIDYLTMIQTIDTFRDDHTRGCAYRSPEASQTQLGRVKAICDLARLASGIIVVISVFNSLLNNSVCLCTAWHAHTVFSYVYGTKRIRSLTHK